MPDGRRYTDTRCHPRNVVAEACEIGYSIVVVASHVLIGRGVLKGCSYWEDLIVNTGTINGLLWIIEIFSNLSDKV